MEIIAIIATIVVALLVVFLTPLWTEIFNKKFKHLIGVNKPIEVDKFNHVEKIMKDCFSIERHVQLSSIKMLPSLFTIEYIQVAPKIISIFCALFKTEAVAKTINKREYFSNALPAFQLILDTYKQNNMPNPFTLINDWHNARLNGLVFKNFALSDISFQGTELIDCVFENMELSNIDMIGARTERAIFRNSRLNKINFYQADLEDAKFENSTLSDIRFLEANLWGADFSNALQVDQCDFRRAKVYCRPSDPKSNTKPPKDLTLEDLKSEGSLLEFRSD